MKLLKELINTFRYGGLTEQELKMCMPEIRKRTINTLGWIVPVLMGAMGVLFIVSLIPGSGEESNRRMYLSYFSILLMQFLLLRLYFIKNQTHVLILNYLLMFTLYSFGIMQTTLLGYESSNTAYCVLLTIVPLLVIDRPFRLAITTIGVEIILLIAHHFVNGVWSDRFVVVESLCCTFLGICCGYVIQKTKLSDIRNHLMLEVQRDTDMMTGACSRVAYIRDIGMMSVEGVTAGVIFADVNGLKKTNDTYGHEAGDRLIKNAFSLMLQYFHNTNDRIYRIGGDEFVIISLGETEDDFNTRFLAMAEEDDQKEIISCGKVWLDKVHNAEEAIKEAEKMMYVSKDKFYDSHPEHERRKG